MLDREKLPYSLSVSRTDVNNALRKSVSYDDSYDVAAYLETDKQFQEAVKKLDDGSKDLFFPSLKEA